MPEMNIAMNGTVGKLRKIFKNHRRLKIYRKKNQNLKVASVKLFLNDISMIKQRNGIKIK